MKASNRTQFATQPADSPADPGAIDVDATTVADRQQVDAARDYIAAGKHHENPERIKWRGVP